MQKIFITCSFALFFWSVPVQAERAAQENLLRAVFIEKFTRFIEWPEESLNNNSNNFNLCVLRNKRFFNTLEGIYADLKIKKREVAVLLVKELKGLTSCHIVYISRVSLEELSSLINQVKNKGVLIIGEIKGYAELGAHINLLRVGERLKLEVNADAIAKSGLKASSKLLKYAHVVIGRGN